MTAQVVSVVIWVSGVVVMGGLSLLIGIVRGRNSVETEFPRHGRGRSGDRPPQSPLSY
jgi:hypothetical protein